MTPPTSFGPARARPTSPCRALEVDGKPAPLARAGDSADVTLTGIEPNMVGAGSVLCLPDFPVPLVHRWAGRKATDC